MPPSDSNKKRKRLTDPAAGVPSPSPSTSSSAAPSPAPLSAVAARRAAREAQQSANNPAVAQATPSTAVDVQQDQHQNDASSSSDEEPLPAKRTAIAKSGTVKVSGKGKGKAPARYFAPPEQREDVMLLDVEEENDSEAEDDGPTSPPEGLDDGEEEVLASSSRSVMDMGDEGARTPRSRRRREKRFARITVLLISLPCMHIFSSLYSCFVRVLTRCSYSAFVDPYCVSAVQIVNEVSAVRVRLSVDAGAGTSKEGVIYALREGENLVIHGAFLLAPLYGSVTAMGATFHASPPANGAIPLPCASSPLFQPFFCPASHPLPLISALARSSSSDDDEDASSPFITLLNGETMDLSRFEAAVLIIDLESGIEGVERPLSIGGMGAAVGMWPRVAGKAAGGLEGGKTWRLITAPVPSLTSLRPLAHWEAALAAALPSAVTSGASRDPGRFVALVEGPKRVGKSTVARMAVNALLDRYEAVAYLDTDLGQPELTPPGFVSLHVLRRPLTGPSFTHLALPLSSHFLGTLSPASDPAGYLAAIEALLELYSLEVEYPMVDEPAPAARRRRGRFAAQQAGEEAQGTKSKVRERVPLVVNTQGWVKGMGADLLTKLKAAASPTAVFSFAASHDDAPIDPYAAAGQEPPYHLLVLPPAPPASPLESKYSAADYRTMSLVSYFHTLYATAGSDPTLPSGWDFTHSLVATSPYPLSWRADDNHLHSVHLVAPGIANGEIRYEHILHAVNGAVVALCTAPSGGEDRPTRPFPYDPSLPSPPPPRTSRALGLALIHSITPSTSTLNLLTPLPPTLLASSTPLILVSGALELPVALMLDYSAGVSGAVREVGVGGVEWASGGVPFLVKGEEGNATVGVGGKRRVRRNLMRRGQA
ncbi:hypothetical protein JCM11641_000394 [Rhodosporidiobolus odoratus]